MTEHRFNRHYVASMRRRKRMIWLYTEFLFIWSLSIAIMPLGSMMKESSRLPMYLSGAMFWIGFAGTVGMTIRINYCRRNSYGFNEQFPKLKQFGLIHFFQNKAAIVADVAMFVSIIGIIVSRFVTNNLFSVFLFIAIFLFAFGMHCMLNGANYRYIKYKIRSSVKS